MEYLSIILLKDPTIIPGTGPKIAAESTVPRVSRYNGIPSAAVIIPSTILSATQTPQNAVTYTFLFFIVVSPFHYIIVDFIWFCTSSDFFDQRIVFSPDLEFNN